MTHVEATDLIKDADFDKKTPCTWADLGCGSGTFTRALAAHLHPKSIIYAVDVQKQQFDSGNTAEIKSVQLDFEKKKLPFDNLNGILMANSLHFVNDKSLFIEKLKGNLKENGHLVIVEYDTETPNPWVPYPIIFTDLKVLLSNSGFDPITKIGERKSIYNSNVMYACFARKKLSIMFGHGNKS